MTGVTCIYHFALPRRLSSPDGYQKNVIFLNDQFPDALVETYIKEGISSRQRQRGSYLRVSWAEMSQVCSISKMDFRSMYLARCCLIRSNCALNCCFISISWNFHQAISNICKARLQMAAAFYKKGCRSGGIQQRPIIPISHSCNMYPFTSIRFAY